MAVLGASTRLPALQQTISHLAVAREDRPNSTSVSFCGCLKSSAAEASERLKRAGTSLDRSSGSSGRSGGRLVVVGRAGGSRPPAGARRPRISGPRRTAPVETQGDGTLLNNDIRVPVVRLLDEEQNMVGVVSTSEALSKARNADLDLVMISPDADPPVCRIMDYSKFRYEQQKRKREAQKKAAASRQELKELKMRYNIDTHDYDVRLRAAKRFLLDGDKVKVVCQFKGREMDFKDLAFKLFQRFTDNIGELGVIESKMSIEGRAMNMIIGPNKTAVAKIQSQAQSDAAADKKKGKAQQIVKDEALKTNASDVEEEAIEASESNATKIEDSKTEAPASV